MLDTIQDYGLRYKWFFAGGIIFILVVLYVHTSLQPDCVGCRGKDADIKELLLKLSTQSEIIYDNYGSYNNVCSRPYAEGGAADIVTEIASDSKDVTCADSPTAWALEAQFRRDDDIYFCVDNTGTATTTTGDTIGDFVCG